MSYPNISSSPHVPEAGEALLSLSNNSTHLLHAQAAQAASPVTLPPPTAAIDERRITHKLSRSNAYRALVDTDTHRQYVQCSTDLHQVSESGTTGTLVYAQIRKMYIPYSMTLRCARLLQPANAGSVSF